MPAAENRKTGSSRGRAAGAARALRLDRSVGLESPGTLMRSKTDRARDRGNKQRVLGNRRTTQAFYREVLRRNRPRVSKQVSQCPDSRVLPRGPGAGYATAGQCRSQPVAPRKRLNTPAVWGGPLREKMAGTEGVTVNIFRRGLPKRDGASLLEFQYQAVCQRSPGKGTTSEIRSHNSALSCSRSIVAAARYPRRSPCAWPGFEARDRPRLLGTL